MAHAATARPVVLIVEDEFFIRMCAVQIIQDAGFDVVEAADAYEAIAVLESHGDIRVVFTDIRMPGSMDGLKLAHAVRHRWPPVHIIATSGYHAITATDLPAGSVFLLKPYSERSIVDALHALTAPC
jgi:CheY-like chemotaxis protein